MKNIKHIFNSFKVAFKSTVEKSHSDEAVDSAHKKGRCVENDSNQPDLEKSVDQAMDYSCIESDFTNNMLFTEMMRIGHDPANMSRKQMIEILYKHMNSKKPTTIENIPQEDD